LTPGLNMTAMCNAQTVNSVVIIRLLLEAPHPRH